MTSNDRDGGPIIIVGFMLGCLFMGLTSAFLNRDYTDLSKAEEICAIHNSTPKEYDAHSELVCDNGVEVNYRSYKAD